MSIKITHISGLLLFLLCFATKTIAQPSVQWDKTFGGSNFDALTTASRTLDGGYLLCGLCSSPKGFDVSEENRGSEGSDYWIVKTDSLGNKIFDKRYGGSKNDICWKVLQNEDGFLLIGESNSDKSGDKSENSKGGRDFWLVQIRPDGSYVWDKTLGGEADDVPISAIKAANGSYIIAGHSFSKASGDKSEENRGVCNLWIVKIDKLGNKIWDKTFGGNGSDDYPNSIIKLKNGHYLVACGSTSGASGEHSAVSRGAKDMWIIEFDENGNKIIDKGFGGTDEDTPYGLQQVSDGSVFIAGSSKSEANGDKTSPNFGDYDYWILKLDKNYKKIWDKSFGGKAQDNLTVIDQNKTGYILIGGNSSSNPSGNKTDSVLGLQDFWFLYLDESGNIIWDKTYGGRSNDAPKDIVSTPTGDYLLCGGSSSNKGFSKSEDSRGGDDFWVAKIRCFFDVNLGNDTLVCGSKAVTFDATVSNCKNCLYEWSTGENKPRITVTPEKTQYVSVKITSSDACVFKKQIQLVLIPSPDSATYIVKPPRCTDGNDAVIALDYAHGGTSPYFLVLNRDTFARQIFIDKLKAGTYNVQLVDKKGCFLESKVVVPNPSPFSVTITPSFELPFGDSFRMVATASKPLNSFFWSDRTITTLDTFLKPFDSQTYSFTGIDTLGCSRTTSMQVLVRRDNLFFAPNVFSPNGDLINDIYKIYGGKTVVSIDGFKIFNRWGEFMYEFPRIFPSEAAVGWDGKFNGKDAAVGTYMYSALVTYIDGKTERIKGDFVLMR